MPKHDIKFDKLDQLCLDQTLSPYKNNIYKMFESIKNYSLQKTDSQSLTLIKHIHISQWLDPYSTQLD